MLVKTLYLSGAPAAGRLDSAKHVPGGVLEDGIRVFELMSGFGPAMSANPQLRDMWQGQAVVNVHGCQTEIVIAVLHGRKSAGGSAKKSGGRW